MTTEGYILLAVVAIGLIATIGVKLYNAKKNDGVITKEEIADIVSTIRNGVVGILEDAQELKDVGATGGALAEREFVKKQLAEKVSKSTMLNDREKSLLNNNTDEILDYIIENKNKIIKAADAEIAKPQENPTDSCAPAKQPVIENKESTQTVDMVDGHIAVKQADIAPATTSNTDQSK